jgi:hypothetical protein
MPEIKKAAEKLPQTEKIHTLTQKVEYRKEYKNQGVFRCPVVGTASHGPFAQHEQFFAEEERSLSLQNASDR